MKQAFDGKVFENPEVADRKDASEPVLTLKVDEEQCKLIGIHGGRAQKYGKYYASQEWDLNNFQREDRNGDSAFLDNDTRHRVTLNQGSDGSISVVQSTATEYFEPVMPFGPLKRFNLPGVMVENQAQERLTLGKYGALTISSSEWEKNRWASKATFRSSEKVYKPTK